MSDNPIKDVEEFARDAVYAAVGLGVLGFQKAQVRRREIADALAHKGVDLGEPVRAAGHTLRPPFDALRPQLDALRPQIDALRPQAEAIGTQLMAAAAALRPQIESLGSGVADLLKSMEEHAAPMRQGVDARVSEIEEHLPPGPRAAFDQLRARAAAQEEALHWIIRLLSPESHSSEAGDAEGTGKPDAGEPPAAPPAME